ncbi:hypothetical protein BJY01DRAFT_240940 [Aspergillus pseudoustus]|uniref:Uncharacterized protein n=1 Tax=Aspergillus pseudoustus TaxID=1810923 RepID=A0ABR4IKQ5_9EURO
MDNLSILWKQIFKDTSWLDFASTFDWCSPVLIGHNLSAYRPRESTTCLYLALITYDYSGDLRFKGKRFFSTLQDKWEYNQNKYKVHFSSGITLNIYNIINGYKTIKLPLERVFTNTREGVYSEYYYYKYPAIRELRLSNITKWDPDYRTHPRAPPGWWNSPASKGRDIKKGCRITLLDWNTKMAYVVIPSHPKSKPWAKIALSKRDCLVR